MGVIIEFDPEGVILTIVLFGSYPDPLSIILTWVIFPLETSAFSFAKDPNVPISPRTSITSKSGGVVYSDPLFEMVTASILPSATMGVINPFFPVKKDVAGCFW